MGMTPLIKVSNYFTLIGSGALGATSFVRAFLPRMLLELLYLRRFGLLQFVPVYLPQEQRQQLLDLLVKIVMQQL